ncbi:hypothetical protein Tco_0003890 [Tanacetum coccineum]
MQSSKSCVKCLDLDVELLNKQTAYNDLSKSYSQLEKHCISLELIMQLNQEIFQKDSLSYNQNAIEIPEYFENNDLKALLRAKDITICKLKEHIKSMRDNDKEEKVKQEMDDIETINNELEHSVAKLLSENERLHEEIEHLKNQFDSIKKTHVLSKEHCDSLITQLNFKSIENADLKGQIQEKVFVTTTLQSELKRLKGKHVLDNATTMTNATTISPGMFKLDIEPLSHRLKNNRDTHDDYLKKTIENTNTICGLVEHARKQNPIKPFLDFACKFTKYVHEFDPVSTCPVPIPLRTHFGVCYRLVSEPEAPPSPDDSGRRPTPSQDYSWPGWNHLLLFTLPYVPEPEYPEFMPPEDHVFPAEEQPLPAVVSPTADSPGYIPESDPEEEDEEDPEEDPAYYPADIGDDDEEDEEEEHLAFCDFTVPFLVIGIPESCLPPRKRPRLASPTPIYEVGETSAAGAARLGGCTWPLPREDFMYVAWGIDLWHHGLMSGFGVFLGETNQSCMVCDGACSRRYRYELRGRRSTYCIEIGPIHHHLAVMVEREAWMAREAGNFLLQSTKTSSVDYVDLKLIKGLQTRCYAMKALPKLARPMIDEGVKAAGQALDTTRNGDDSHFSWHQICDLNSASDALTWWICHVKTTTPEWSASCHAIGNTEKKMTINTARRGVDQEDEAGCGILRGLIRGINCPKLKNNNNRGNRVGNAKLRHKGVCCGKYRGKTRTTMSSRIMNYDVELEDGADCWVKHYYSGLYVKLLKSSFQHRPNARRTREKNVRIPFGDEILIVRLVSEAATNTADSIEAIFSCIKLKSFPEGLAGLYHPSSSGNLESIGTPGAALSHGHHID